MPQSWRETLESRLRIASLSQVVRWSFFSVLLGTVPSETGVVIVFLLPGEVKKAELVADFLRFGKRGVSSDARRELWDKRYASGAEATDVYPSVQDMRF